ncbi:PilN domain-containing protein [Massilia horti]|uniref:MSHA biogenesis protein MshI n=1 Tax=Massilia horti TaxID=2562153 RepID=A0A4Y9T1V7_9BURK|nr:PilN domain-containing protein [Massilia horti]TFW30980.1 hypothetical protein E4O92_14825 [Massilia horti]
MSQQINLFNPEFQQKRRMFSTAMMAQGVGALVVLMAALAWMANAQLKGLQQQANTLARQLTQKQERLARVSAEFAPHKKSSELEAELQEAEAQLASLHQVFALIERGDLGNTQGYAEYFRALARQNVDGLWLTGVSIGAAGAEIGVRGRALDPALLPDYLGRLTREKTMQGKAFGSLQISQAAPAKVAGKDEAQPPYVEFSLQARPEGGQP